MLEPITSVGHKHKTKTVGYKSMHNNCDLGYILPIRKKTNIFKTLDFTTLFSMKKDKNEHLTLRVSVLRED